MLGRLQLKGMDMSSVVLVSDKAMIGIEIDMSKWRVDPVGNVRDLFLLESIFGKLEVMFDKEPGARTRWEGFGDLEE